MKVLVIDVGGTHVKILMTGRRDRREMPSGPRMTAAQMATGVKQLAGDWKYDVVSMGYPGPVLRDRPVAEPQNLGSGWVAFDFARAFACPIRIINDAAMQALGAYRGGKMLFLGLGTGLGSALVVDGMVEGMELGHLPYRKKTYEHYVGLRGLEKFGRKKWRSYVTDVIQRLVTALEPDDVVIGGGNAALLKQLPARARFGGNADAFAGGLRMWAPKRPRKSPARTGRGSRRRAKSGRRS
ncbi:MAG: ROK family protein [Casimicrobiaceae bacterium]